MRNEKEMFNLIVGIAKKDERIRAVYMNGSRTNKNIKKDIFQDYDIVYVVQETRPFYEDKEWINIFGERLFMQCPDEVDKSLGKEVDFDKCFTWLIQLKDGNRVDLKLSSIKEIDILEDKLCRILLDKDKILPPILEATDEDYWIKKPTQAEFSACCNEFWWCLNNIAKGLWREEIPYIQQMYYDTNHKELMKMLNWKVGYETDFRLSTGKASKYIKSYLSDEIWNKLLETYINGNITDIWQSVFVMCDLFNKTALEIEEKYKLIYNKEEAEASYRFLKHVYLLPKDAEEI